MKTRIYLIEYLSIASKHWRPSKECPGAYPNKELAVWTARALQTDSGGIYRVSVYERIEELRPCERGVITTRRSPRRKGEQQP